MIFWGSNTCRNCAILCTQQGYVVAATLSTQCHCLNYIPTPYMDGSNSVVANQQCNIPCMLCSIVYTIKFNQAHIWFFAQSSSFKTMLIFDVGPGSFVALSDSTTCIGEECCGGYDASTGTVAYSISFTRSIMCYSLLLLYLLLRVHVRVFGENGNLIDLFQRMYVFHVHVRSDRRCIIFITKSHDQYPASFVGGLV